MSFHLPFDNGLIIREQSEITPVIRPAGYQVFRNYFPLQIIPLQIPKN